MTDVPRTLFSVWDDYACAGGVRLADLPEWGEGTGWSERIGGDRGACSVTLPVTSDYAQYLAIGNVIRIEDRGLGTWEYRIGALADGRNADLITATAYGPIAELGKVRLTVANGGTTQQAITSAPLTPTQWITDYLLPALADRGLTWISTGTITPTDLLPFTFQRQSALWLLTQLEQQTGSEAWLARDGETGYLLHLGTRGAGDPSPRCWVGVNVASLDRDVATEEMFTQTYPVGATETGATEPTHIGQAAWRVDNAAATSATMTLSDPETADSGPIAFSDQLVGSKVVQYLDPVYFRNASQVHAVAARSGVVWAIITPSETSTRALAWYDLATNTQGRVTLSATPDANARGLAMGLTRLYVASGSTVCVVTLSTKTESATIAAATTISGLWSISTGASSRAIIDYADGVNNADIIVTATITGALAGQAAAWGANYGVFTADTTSGRIVGLKYGTTDLRFWNGTTFAAIGNRTLPANAYALGPENATTYAWIVYTGAVQAYLVGSDVLSASTSIPTTGGVAFSTIPAHRPIVYGTALLAVLTAPASQSAVWGIPLSSGSAATAPSDGPALFPGAPAGMVGSSNDTTQGFVGALGTGLAWRVSPTANATPAQVGSVATASTAQVVTTAAGITWYDDALVEFRADTDLAYNTLLTHPAMVASYGAIDGDTSRGDMLARRNYCRLGAFDLWGTDDYPVMGDLPNAGGASAALTRAFRWRSESPADTTVTATATGAVASNAIPISALLVTLQPGDLVIGGGGAGRAWVRQRVAAGATSIPITYGITGGGAGTTYTIYRAAPTLPDGATDCLVLYSKDSASPTDPDALTVDVPVPAIAGDSTVQVVALVGARLSNASPADIRLSVTAPGGTSATTLVSDDTATYTDHSYAEWGLTIPVSIPSTVTRAGYVRVVLDVTNTSFAGVVYLRSLMVLVAPDATAQLTTPIRFSHANALHRAGNIDLAQAGPRVSYRVRAIEDEPDTRPIALGVEVDLHDPDFGIEHATPRVVEIQYEPTAGSDDGRLVPARFPVLTLDSRPRRLSDALVRLEDMALA